MKHHRLLALVSSVTLAIGLAAGGQAQTGGGYDLTWNTIAPGGVMTSTGNGYVLAGVIGQSDAGAASGGGYTLNGGFLFDDTLRTYLPVVLRSH
jgi:hypothetical protein